MVIASTYSKKIKETQYNKAFVDTTKKYRQAVDFFIDVGLREYEALKDLSPKQLRVNKMEHFTVKTNNNPTPKYDFGKEYYKFPSYLRRAAISEALGKVFSYKSNLANWELNPVGKKPGLPKAGYVCPALYRKNTFNTLGPYTAEVKVWIRNTWDWATITFNKGDCDYIARHCCNRKECAPTLRKRGKEWFLDFPFEESASLIDVPIENRVILAVDLGINSPCTCVAMKADGTVLGRHFLKLPREQDSLNRATNRIKKAQQHGARKTPVLWALANGTNDNIAVKTAQFIVDCAVLHSAFTVVFEKLDVRGKKRGGKKQKLHLWRANYVQTMVTDKAHRLGIHISRVCAWNTSRLAFDGSGKVERGKEANLGSYSVCRFKNGKVYNCDLNAAYNIGARYFIREILKSSMVTPGLAIPAKVPECSKRSTCTLSTLINLNAVLAA